MNPPPPPPAPSLLPPEVNRVSLVRSSIVVTLCMVLAAGLILVLTGQSYWGAFRGGATTSIAIPAGIAIGVWLGVIITLGGALLPVFHGFQAQVEATFRQIRPTNADLAILSVGAGVGEELLFRAALQPFLGLWVTSALFALAHGTLTRLTWGRVAYALGLFVGGLILGLVFEKVGLLAAMITHASYDFTALWITRRVALRGDPTPGSP